nr:four-jointed box protein 1 isoform X4 [Manis javanica]
MSPRSCGHRLRPGPDPTPEPKEPPDSTPPVRRHRPRGPQAAGSPSRTPKTLPKDRIWARRGGSPSYPSRGGHCPLPSHRAPPGRHLEARPPRPRAVHAGTRWSPAPHPRRPLQPGGARVARWSRSRGRRLPSADLPLLGPPRRGAEAQTNGRRAREREPQLEMHGQLEVFTGLALGVASFVLYQVALFLQDLPPDKAGIKSWPWQDFRSSLVTCRKEKQIHLHQ